MTQLVHETPGSKPFGHRGYLSVWERAADMRRLKRRGVNYFVYYRDAQAEIAMQYLTCTWATGESIRATASKYGFFAHHYDQFHGPHTLDCTYTYVLR